MSFTSDASTSSPAFLSPYSILEDINDYDFMDADIFLDRLYGPDSDSSDMGIKDGMTVSIARSDSNLDRYATNLGKTIFKTFTSYTLFSPLLDYKEISDWDFKIRSDGLLGDLIS